MRARVGPLVEQAGRSASAKPQAARRLRESQSYSACDAFGVAACKAAPRKCSCGGRIAGLPNSTPGDLLELPAACHGVPSRHLRGVVADIRPESLQVLLITDNV